MAPHSSNTEEGWQTRQKEKQQECSSRVEEVTDEESPNVGWSKAKSFPYQFTSTVQDQVSAGEIQNTLLNTKVMLSLREILDMSPKLQKHMQAIVKTQQEFNVQAKAGAYELDKGKTNEGIIQLNTDELRAALLTYDMTTENLKGILERYACAVFLGARKYFAMAGGLVKGIFEGKKVTFLVNLGSELKLVTQRVFKQTGLIADIDGNRWNLRGISGDPI
jgi:hypothetical protein